MISTVLKPWRAYRLRLRGLARFEVGREAVAGAGLQRMSQERGTQAAALRDRVNALVSGSGRRGPQPSIADRLDLACQVRGPHELERWSATPTYADVGITSAYAESRVMPSGRWDRPWLLGSVAESSA